MCNSEQAAVADQLDVLGALADQFDAIVTAAQADTAVEFAEHDIQRITGAAISLYALTRDRGQVTCMPAVDPSTTEMLVLVADLLAAHDINTFDLALWLSHAGAGR
ncbi:hypothetical protein [Nocardia vaccinii]|uniref:hypothetical protein n=1 Tax=Nocardia vaccinii TaxID=1822 RepID=UPI00082A9678|nr:hypothetical protein [Nocardia vaccinii]